MPAFSRLTTLCLALAGLLARPAASRAQCPAAACAVGAASQGGTTLAASAKMGIYSVTLGGLNNPSAGYTDGYQDYSCTQQTTLTVSAPTTISIKTGTLVPENVRVWIDYDHDGTFADAEMAFSSDAALTHTGTITPPAGAVLGQVLRLRVAADGAGLTGVPVPTACSTPVYSQDEDYGVTLAANSLPPVAAFAVDAATTCSGTVQFTDQSANAPTSWQWYFGDDNTSTAQNPTHTYAQAGTYQVQLTATNAAGNSTSAATTITYNPAVPVAASCPGLKATDFCCNYGILRVRLGSIDNTSANGSAGYQDFTCPQRTSLTVGTKATLTIKTDTTLQHDTRAWLDLNNDGIFTNNELIVTALAKVSPSVVFTVPTTAVLGQPLRLRILVDGVGNTSDPCKAPVLGQVEDYTVTVVPNTKAPTAAFTSDYVPGSCTTPVNTYTFSDQSGDGPTSWQWSFSPDAGVSYVGGTSATSANPQVNFSVAGTYAVTLTASNVNGSSTATKADYLTVQVPCTSYCASNGGGGGPGGGNSGFWITEVALSAATGGPAFDNKSGNATGGYALYATPAMQVRGGSTQTLTVTTNRQFNHRTSVWIDYNRDGVFDNSTERVYSATQAGNRVQLALALPATVAATRMRITVALNNNNPNPCATNQGEAEVEDYVLSPLLPLATRPGQALAALLAGPVPSADGHLQVQLPDASAAGRYTVEALSVLGARLLATELRLSATSAAALDLSGLPAGLYLLRFTNEQGQSVVRRVVRE